MARSTGVVLGVGGITLFNQVILNQEKFTWKVPIATAIAALMLDGLEHVAPDAAVALAWLALVTVVFTRVNPNVPSPAESLLNAMGRK